MQSLYICDKLNYRVIVTALANLKELEGREEEAGKLYRFVAENGGELSIRKESQEKI